MLSKFKRWSSPPRVRKQSNDRPSETANLLVRCFRSLVVPEESLMSYRIFEVGAPGTTSQRAIKAPPMVAFSLDFLLDRLERRFFASGLDWAPFSFRSISGENRVRNRLKRPFPECAAVTHSEQSC